MIGHASPPDAVPREELAARILEACRARFPDNAFEVRCDSHLNVWVKRVGGLRSVGLSPWQLRDHTAEQILSGTESKLAL